MTTTKSTANGKQSTVGGLVVVTGASSGIGRSTARQLADDGYHVLAGVRKRVDAERLAADNLEPVLLDITDPAQVAAVADRVVQDPEGRPLRALVNNAGIAINAPVETLPLNEWRRQFEVGVFAQIAMIQALLPALLAGRGRIIMIGSAGGKVAMPSFGAYSGAKFAMEAVSDALRREVEPLGVKVVVVIPGAMRTGMTASGLGTATRLADTMTPDQHARYDPLVRAYQATVTSFEANGLPPDRAAAVITTAITTAKPRTRYTVGRDAAMMVLLARFVPDRVLDRVLRRQMRLGAT